jgi:hypothetical protein
VPAYPARDANTLLSHIFEEMADGEHWSIEDAVDAGYLMSRGEAVVLRTSGRKEILLTVKTCDWVQEDEDACDCGADVPPEHPGHHPDCPSF